VSRKNLKVILENITITDVAAEGKAIARHENMVVFVPFAIPGDVVNIEVKKKQRKFLEGRILEYVKYSPDRETPFCKHFGTCGGCKWQILPYQKQLHYKQKQVVDNLTRIGKVQLPEISPILGSDLTREYRNKLEFTFSPKRWLTSEEMEKTGIETRGLGFHIPTFFDKIVDIDHCYLQAEPVNEIRNAMRQFAIEHNLAFYDQRTHEGFLRNLIIRNSNTGGLMVIVIFAEKNEKEIQNVMQFLADQFGAKISSLLYIVNTKLNDTYTDLPYTVFAGIDHMIEEMGGLKFKMGPKSFYQTNSQQAANLYQVAKDFAGLTGTETVYDLYTGTGTIACFVADKANKVVGIEYVEDAITDAKVNAQWNGLNHVHFFAGDMKDVLNEGFIQQHGQPDVIITDPPRAGMHADVVQTILKANPSRIVYVSCNPATQARDLELMDTQYKVEKVQPVDMFPHTHHVENVVLLTRR
jgi:23S rRNA (uracil1939-C5)-methyltransferase